MTTSRTRTAAPSRRATYWAVKVTAGTSSRSVGGLGVEPAHDVLVEQGVVLGVAPLLRDRLGQLGREREDGRVVGDDRLLHPGDDGLLLGRVRRLPERRQVEVHLGVRVVGT